MGFYWHSLLSLELRQSEAVLPRRSTLIIGGTATLIISGTATVIISGTATVITDETGMIVTETIDMMTGMGITTPTRSHDSRATATAYRRARQMPNVVKATIRNDHTSGRTAMTATTRATETGVSTNRSFVTHLSKATTKVTSVTVGATAAVTTDDGETAVYGPGK